MARLPLRGGLYRSLTVALSLACAVPDANPQTSDPNFIHGTIVVVISAKDGFVLAGDSRGSRGCTAVPGEFEKVFTFGNRSAIVVAGMIASSEPSGELSEALATDFRLRDQGIVPANEPQATSTMGVFVDSVDRELLMLDPSSTPASPVAAASAVSINEHGGREWITLRLNPVTYPGRGRRKRLTTKVDQFLDPPPSLVQALGSGASVVDEIVALDGPTVGNPYSQAPGLDMYYSLKKAGKLSDLTLGDGELLVRSLVEAAIDVGAKSPCMGVGGSIDILTVTKNGTEWVQKKKQIAPSPPVYRVRIVDSQMFGRIDGGEWIRPRVPANGTITFSGDGETRVVEPSFEGPCKFVIGRHAEARMPPTADRLKSLFGKACGVFLETASGQIKISSPARSRPAAIVPNYDREYASLCDTRLRDAAIAYASQIREFVQTFENQDLQPDLDRFALMRLPQEDRNVAGFKSSLLRADRDSQFTSEYDSQIVPRATSIERELLRRVHGPLEHGTAEERGWTTMEIADVAREIDQLAGKLPEDCSGSQAGKRDPAR